MNLERCGQDISDEFLGGGFAIAAGHGKHGTGPCVSVGHGKLLQCDERVFDHGDVGVGFPGRVGGDCMHGSGLQCMLYEGVAIEIRTPNGDVNVVFEINTGVNRYATGPRSYLEQVFHGF